MTHQNLRARTPWMLACLLATGCANYQTTPPSPPRPDSIPDSWSLYSNKAFSFYAPVGIQEIPYTPEDSFAGRLEHKDFQIFFDYGWYSDDSFEGHLGPQAPAPPFEVEDVVISGRPAQIAFYEKTLDQNPHTLVSAAYIPDIFELGKNAPGKTSLSFVIRYKGPGLADDTRKILMSLQLTGVEWSD